MDFSVRGSIILVGDSPFVKKMAFPSCPITNSMTLDEVQKLDLRVKNIETSEGWTSEWYDSFCDEQMAGAKQCANILVGKPTGNIYFNKGTILQEVVVQEVLKGKCKYKKIWLQNGYLSTLEYEKGKVMISGMDRSFMQEDATYLLFCDSLATNRYSDKKVYTETEGMWFGCYSLTRSSDIVMEEGNNKYNEEIEFYTSSEKTIEYYNKAKQMLIEKYCNKY